MLLVTHQSVVILSLVMELWCLYYNNLLIKQNYQCCEMLPGLCQTSVVENHSRSLSRYVVYSVCCDAPLETSNISLTGKPFCRSNQLSQLLLILFIQMMKKFLQMHVGLFPIFLMVLMIKSKLWLRLVYALVLSSFCCKLSNEFNIVTYFIGCQCSDLFWMVDDYLFGLADILRHQFWSLPCAQLVTLWLVMMPRLRCFNGPLYIWSFFCLNN